MLTAGVPSASMAYLQRHSRATLVNSTPVEPMVGIVSVCSYVLGAWADRRSEALSCDGLREAVNQL